MLGTLIIATLALNPAQGEKAESLDEIRRFFGFSQGMASLAISNAPRASTCRECHQKEYAQWSKSRHARSTSNALFRQGIKHEARIRCVRCHAPLEQQVREAQALYNASKREFEFNKLKSYAFIHEGITCATCHVRDQKVLAGANFVADARAPQNLHALVREPRLSESAFCGGCHEFVFQKREQKQFVLSDSPTQTTFSEWTNARAKDATVKSCVGCHMPNKSHRFLGAHDDELLRRSLLVKARAGSITLTSQGVGHRFPSGDLFRHLRVEVDAGSGFEEVARFGKRFVIDQRGESPLKRLAENNALYPGVPEQISGLPTKYRFRVRYLFTNESNLLRAELTKDERETLIAQGQVGYR